MPVFTRQQKTAQQAKPGEVKTRSWRPGTPAHASSEVTAKAEARLGALRGRGFPLAPGERAFFEARLGHDFSRVRVHTGPVAAKAARAVGARAFTVGEAVVFGDDAYAPAQPQGRRLLAHELAHVVQQRGEAGTTVVRREPADDEDEGVGAVAVPEAPSPEATSPEAPAPEATSPEAESSSEAESPEEASPEAEAPAAASVKFQEHPSQVYQGFDATADPVKLLVIPDGSGSRKVKVVVEPHGAKVAYFTLGPNPITVNPVGDAGDVEISGTSGGDPGMPSEVQAIQPDGTVLARLGIFVLPRQEVSVGYHFMSDPPREKMLKNMTPAHTKRSAGEAASLTETLNKVWLPQANIHFSTQGATPDVFKSRQISNVGGTDDQLKQLFSPFTSGAQMEVFLVWELRSSKGETTDANGRYVRETNYTILEDNDAPDGFDLAHEAGHFFGRIEHTKTGLMAPTTAGPDRPRVQAGVASGANWAAGKL